MPAMPHYTFLIRLIFPAIALGLAWAVRGHFGHEWGAAWAGSIGSMAVLLASGRTDWLRILPIAAVVGGIGWGIGGMMSYGIVVGYGRSNDFLNVYYGFTMLGIIGGLYGFLGGGFLGATLESTNDKKVDWARLLTEMVAGAMLCWGLLIYQLEWFMTPPRSELWAACMGAALALAWYLHRNGFNNALRVAQYSGLGAGLGFAIGNFLQVAGNVAGVSFNWWNVMEYSLGFFGGLGMALGIMTSTWKEARLASEGQTKLSVFILLIAIPATNLIQALDSENMQQLGAQLALTDIPNFIRTQQLLGWGSAGLLAALGYISWSRKKPHLLFFLFTILFVLEGHFRKGFLGGTPALQTEHYLYWVNILVLAFVWYRFKKTSSYKPIPITLTSTTRLLVYFLLALAVCAWIATRLHEGLPGAHVRF